MRAAPKFKVFLLATECTTVEPCTMATARNTTFKHVCKGLRGYIQHKHRGPCFLIMGTLK